MSPVTDLLICEPGWVLLEWDFSSTTKTVQVETTKDFVGLGPSYDRFLWGLALSDKENAAVAWCLGTPVYSTGHQTYDGTFAFLLVKTRENILTDHKAKLSGRRIRRKERRPLVLLRMTNDTRQRQEKTVTISGCQRINRKQKYL